MRIDSLVRISMMAVIGCGGMMVAAAFIGYMFDFDSRGTFTFFLMAAFVCFGFELFFIVLNLIAEDL